MSNDMKIKNKERLHGKYVVVRGKKMRKGDKVIAIAGNDRGKVGTILSCTGDQVIVQGLNVRKKHVKPQQKDQKGSIITLEKAIHISNLKLCNEGGIPVKVKVQSTAEGQKQLVYHVDGQDVVYRPIKKT